MATKRGVEKTGGKVYAKWWPVASLREYEGNPRVIPDEAVDAVARSIELYGFTQPVVADADGVVLAGHTRLRAARKLNLTQVPVVEADLPAGHAQAYRLADNRLGEMTGWNTDALAAELEALGRMDHADMAVPPGFVDAEVGALLSMLDEQAEGEGASADADDRPPPKEDDGYVFLRLRVPSVHADEIRIRCTDIVGEYGAG